MVMPRFFVGADAAFGADEWPMSWADLLKI
jgi:hypothetical protein